MRYAIALVLLLCAFASGAQPRASLEQHPGARLLLQAQAMDEAGRVHRLADFFGDGRPVLLVPGYYRCPQLCGLVMHGLLESLQESGVPRGGWRIVGVSIDPQETSSDARRRRDLDVTYADFLAGATGTRTPPDLHLLTLAPADVQQLTRVLGFRFEPVHDEAAPDARYAHPATVAVLTPHGVVSRYFNGVHFEGAEMRVALADATGDRVGAITSRLALLCAHFDPRIGRHSVDVMNAARIVSLLLVLALGGWIWRHRHGGAR